MTDPRPDRLAAVAAVLMLVVAVGIAVYAFFWPRASPPATRAANVDDVERALVTARRTCVDGPPQGPACAEAARLTEEIAKSKAAR